MVDRSETLRQTQEPRLNFIEFLAAFYHELARQNYPTNHQLKRIIGSILGCQPMKQRFDALSDKGKSFWIDIQEWLEAFRPFLDEKNTNECIQNMLYHLNTGAKTREPGVSLQTSNQVAWILFLLITSESIRALFLELGHVVLEILNDPLQETETSLCSDSEPKETPAGTGSEKALHAGQDLPPSVGKQTLKEKEDAAYDSLDVLEYKIDPFRESRASSLDLPEAASKPEPREQHTDTEMAAIGKVDVIEMPTVTIDTTLSPDTAIVQEEAAQTPHALVHNVSQSNGSDSLSPESQAAKADDSKAAIFEAGTKTVWTAPENANEATKKSSVGPSIDTHLIPIDSSDYYANSFPRFQSRPAANEKPLTSKLLSLIERTLSHPQLSGFLPSLVTHTRKRMDLYRSQETPPPHPYVSQAIAEFQVLWENLCSSFHSGLLQEAILFLETRLYVDAALQEIVIMGLEFLDLTISDPVYAHSEQAIYRGSNLLHMFRLHLFQEYPSQSRIILQETRTMLQGFAKDAVLKRLLHMSSQLMHGLTSDKTNDVHPQLVQDFILVVVPMAALELETFCIPSTTLNVGNWAVVVEEFLVLSTSLVPTEITLSHHQTFHVNIKDPQSCGTIKTLSISMKGIKPELQGPVSYHVQNHRFQESGKVFLKFPLGMDIDLTYSLSNETCPFQLAVYNISLAKIDLVLLKSSHPIFFRVLHSSIQEKVRQALIAHLKEWLVSFDSFLRALITQFKQKIMCWTTMASGEQAFQEELTRQLNEFLESMGLKKEEKDSERRKQMSEGSARASPGRETESVDLSFLPWASHRFSL
ncbi:hypothetical protein HDV03_000131 [Kappamyces sp. JEL0829]|nr:hypothetical protein HDV03_000131 [Kappamyces sp. JEL0829]